MQHGMISTEEGKLFIEPSSSIQGRQGIGQQHTVSKSGIPPPPSTTCTAVGTSRPVDKEVRRKRLVTAARSYVETAVVADQSMLQFHEEENLEAYIFTLMNIVSH